MAKVSNPLQSQTASGSVAEYLTFSKRKTGQQVRFQKRQKDVLSLPRTMLRLACSLAVGNWQGLSFEVKQRYNLLARSRHLSGYNLFVKENLNSLMACAYGQRSYGFFFFGKF